MLHISFVADINGCASNLTLTQTTSNTVSFARRINNVVFTTIYFVQ